MALGVLLWGIIKEESQLYDYFALGVWGAQQYGAWWFSNRFWPDFKADMQARLDEALDDGMVDEDWEKENGELLPPGPNQGQQSSGELDDASL